MMRYGRRRKGRAYDDHWKSFTDIFATVCLMFFFVMVIFGVMSGFLGSQAMALQEDLEAEQRRLIAETLALAEVTGMLDERDQLLVEQRAALFAAQLELEDIREAFYQQINLQLAQMEAARHDFEAIALYRMQMLRRIEYLLGGFLGDEVYVDEEQGILVIEAAFLFDTGSHVVRPQDVAAVEQIRYVLFQIIEEYTDPDGEMLVRFEAFEIRGHTDFSGSGSFNRGLATDRANSIINIIVPNGSIYEYLYAPFFLSGGASLFRPREGTRWEQTEAQMTANRRVEIILHFDDREIEAAIADIANALLEAPLVGFEDHEDQPLGPFGPLGPFDDPDQPIARPPAWLD